jgi:hypothetical protein
MAFVSTVAFIVIFVALFQMERNARRGQDTDTSA